MRSLRKHTDGMRRGAIHGERRRTIRGAWLATSAAIWCKALGVEQDVIGSVMRERTVVAILAVTLHAGKCVRSQDRSRLDIH